MSLPALLALLLGFSLTGYALLAGGDFGAGILDLLAGSRAAERSSIGAAIGPLWEANHVWLIFSITILFSAFPAAFSALGTALLAPLTIALIAIVLRGAALGLRSGHDPETRTYARVGRLFGVASLVAPLLFGAAAGGLAVVSSSVARRAVAPAIPWTGLFAIVMGLLAVCLCVQLSTTFLTVRLARGRQTQVAERFRRRGLEAGAAVLGLSIVGLLVASATAPALAHRLTNAALPLVIIAIVAMGLSLTALGIRRYRAARAGALVGVACLIWGWFVAQSPRLVGTRLTVHAAAATHAALVANAIAIGIVLLAVLPAFYLLFSMFARAMPEVIE